MEHLCICVPGALKAALPKSLSPLRFNALTIGLNTKHCYIQGSIVCEGSSFEGPHRTEKSFWIQEDLTDEQLLVKFRNEYSEIYQKLKNEDTVAISDFSVVSTSAVIPPYEVLLDLSSSNARVWYTSPDVGMKQKASSSAAGQQQAISTPVNASSNTNKKASGLQYVYTDLASLELSSASVNVYGVVKYMKEAAKTRGSDVSMNISLVDPSLPGPMTKLKCVIFAKNPRDLPTVNLGNIVRFHRLKIQAFNGLQGTNGPGFSWLVFDGKVGSPMKPLAASSHNCTLTEEDNDRLIDLRAWADTASDNIFSQPPATGIDQTLDSFHIPHYYDLVCQVLGVCLVDDDKAVLLKVWDGTRLRMPSYCEPEENLSKMIADAALLRIAGDYAVDLWIFDNHVPKSRQLKPGDFVKLTNLHAMVHKCGTPGVVELCLHGGGAVYHRDVLTLDAQSEAVRALRLRLDALTPAEPMNDSDQANQFDENDRSEPGLASTDRTEVRSSSTRQSAVPGLHLTLSQNEKTPPQSCVSQAMSKSSSIVQPPLILPSTSLSPIQSQLLLLPGACRETVMDLSPAVTASHSVTASQDTVLTADPNTSDEYFSVCSGFSPSQCSQRTSPAGVSLRATRQPISPLVPAMSCNTADETLTAPDDRPPPVVQNQPNVNNRSGLSNELLSQELPELDFEQDQSIEQRHQSIKEPVDSVSNKELQILEKLEEPNVTLIAEGDNNANVFSIEDSKHSEDVEASDGIFMIAEDAKENQSVKGGNNKNRISVENSGCSKDVENHDRRQIGRQNKTSMALKPPLLVPNCRPSDVEASEVIQTRQVEDKSTDRRKRKRDEAEADVPSSKRANVEGEGGNDCQSGVESDAGFEEVCRCKHDRVSSVGQLKLTTVIRREHEHIEPVMLHDVLTHACPHKFRVKVHLLDYCPRIKQHPEDFLRLLCPQCKFVGRIPDENRAFVVDPAIQHSSDRLRLWDMWAVRQGTDEDCIPIFACPRCPPQQDGFPPGLQYIFMLQLTLGDGRASLTAQLWRVEAEEFFGVKPIILLSDRGRFQLLRWQLDTLQAGNTKSQMEANRSLEMNKEGRKSNDNESLKKTSTHDSKSAELEKTGRCAGLLMDCCLKSYNVSGGKVAYQIFDTRLSFDY